MRFSGKKFASLIVFWSLAALMVFGSALRAWFILKPGLIPGLNGAYYPVQARAILRTGLPGIPDFPLLFYIQAGLGAIFSLFSPMDQAVYNAVRATDTFLPVLLVIPVFLFIKAFAGKERTWFVVPAAALTVGFIAIGNGSLLRMGGDFQKNAAALPLYLSFVYYLYRSFRDSRRRDYILAFLFFGLTCLTHIGVMALALATAFFAVVAGLASTVNRRRALVIVSLLCVSLLSALALVSLFDPQRVSRLFDVALNLKSVFADSPFVSWFGMNQGPGAPFEMEAVSLGNTLGLLGVMASLYYPHKLESADRIILWAASLSALLFASPFIGREWSQRLSLMAFAPGLAPLAFVSVRMRRGAAASLAIMSAVLWSTANNLPGIEPQTLSMPAYRELQSLRLSLPKGNVIVVARHGLEWWAAWAMNVKVANNLETVRDSWEKYDAVLTLDEIKPGAFTGRGRERPGVNRGEHRSFAGPPGFGGPDFRDPINGFPDWAGGPPRPEEGGPGFERDIEPALYPDMLEMITRGDYFRLSRVTEKPDGDVYGNHPRHR